VGFQTQAWDLVVVSCGFGICRQFCVADESESFFGIYLFSVLKLVQLETKLGYAKI